MELDVINNVAKEKNGNNEIDKFLDDIEEALKSDDKKGKNNIQEDAITTKELDEYWIGTAGDYIFDIASKEIGLSLMTHDKNYKKILDAVEEALKELSKKVGIIYYKGEDGSFWNEELQKECYSVDRYEDGRKTTLSVPKEDALYKVEKGIDKYNYEDVVFVYDEKGKVKIRKDLKEEAIELTKDKLVDLKKEQDKKVKEYKKEGHIYNVNSELGYVIIKDTTQRRVPIEDMEFTIKGYKGDGKYQVVNGEYKKVGEFKERQSKEDKERKALIQDLETTAKELMNITEEKIKKDISLIDINDKNGILYNLVKDVYHIPEEYKTRINSLIKDAIESESMHNEILYVTYDKKKDKYYLDTYNEAHRTRKEISKKEAEKIGIGMFCFKGNNNKLYKDIYRLESVILTLWENLWDDKLMEDNRASLDKQFNRLKNA